MRFTVFTPAYNRAALIPRLYESLKGQTFRDFEWVVVDDGSSDNTKELIESYIAEKPFFPIVFKSIENGGKPNAVNIGVTLASGELFVTLDSDDYFTSDALALLDEAEKTIPENEKSSFSGVAGLKGYQDGRMIGLTFDGETLDCTNLERIKNRVLGDKAEALYTAVMKKYPFPIFEGEKFITESVVLDRMAHDGLKVRYFNKIVMICEYRSDGLSERGKELFTSNPRGYGLYLYEAALFGRNGFKTKWRTYASYINTYKGKMSAKEIAKILHIGIIKVSLISLMLVFYRPAGGGGK